LARGNPRTHLVVTGRRVRGGERNRRRVFLPPEDWYEPSGTAAGGYRIVVQQPGPGYRHVVTPAEIRARLVVLPEAMLDSLEVIQLSRMTRKKERYPCYGMQWGSTLYLYPIAADLIERWPWPPRPNQQTEAAMFGGRWVSNADGSWYLVWTEATIRDYYLNNILIHELGHLLDRRNRRYVDRERYAEWFALHYGYRPSRNR
jgi:hypothetical protein